MGEFKVGARQIMLKSTRLTATSFILSAVMLLVAGNIPLILDFAVSALADYIDGAFLLGIKVCAVILSTCASVFIAAALRMGREYRFWLLSNGRKSEGIFYFFSPQRILKCCAAWLFYCAIQALRFAAFQLPCALFAFFTWYTITDGFEYTALCVSLFVCTIVLFLSGCFFSLVCSGSSILFFPILFEYPEMKSVTAMKLSRSFTDGSLYSIAAFKLSFCTWFPLCLLVFPSLFVWSYYKQSLAVMVKCKSAALFS